MKTRCEMCRDFIPSVQEGVASKESEDFVKAHLLECRQCRKYNREFFEKTKDPKGWNHREEKRRKHEVFSEKKSHWYQGGIFLLVTGFVVGLFLTDSSALFYNAILMPVLGIMAYVLLKGKALYFPLFVFVGEYLRAVIQGLSYASLREVLLSSWVFATIYAFLVLIGTAIAYLLAYSFSKGEEP